MFLYITTIGALVLLFILNKLYKQTNAYTNQFVDIRKYWDMSAWDQNIQLINLGSNHPKFGIDYDGIGIKAVNCAVGPQTFEYDFAILRKITRNLAPGAVVVIPVCLLNFFLYRQQLRATHAKYYTFLSKNDMVGYSRFEKLKYIDLPLLFRPQAIFRLIKDVPVDRRLEMTENPLKTHKALCDDANKWIENWNIEFNIKLPTPALSEKNISDIKNNVLVLRRMLEYCVKYQFKPVIAILPVTDYLASRFSEEFINDHIIKYLKEANVVDAPILNYLRDDRYASSYLYINTFFMNKVGRQLFTKSLIADLKSRDIL